jgi:prepilin-type N-terminal cleavage/methylation domain-containing protein
MDRPPSRGGSYHTARLRGVTLIEMLVVVVMIGILAGIVASKLDWGRYRADSEIRGLLAAMSQAQRTAVSLQTDVRVTVTDGGARLQVHEDANNNASLDTGERVTYFALDHGYRIGQRSMTALPAPAEPGELTALVFRRDGTASRSGSLYLSPPATGASCKYCRAVSIQRATGRTVFWSHATGAWVRAE